MKFVEYFNQNHTALTNFAFKLTRDINEAEDLVQETALKAFRAFDSFRQGSNFKSWAFTILKNTFISNYRRKQRKPQLNASLEDAEFALDFEKHAKNHAVSNLQVEHIKDAFQELSYKSRMPLELYAHGYQYNEIADMMNIPIGTVKSRINYGRRKMKTMLTELKLAG